MRSKGISNVLLVLIAAVVLIGGGYLLLNNNSNSSEEDLYTQGNGSGTAQEDLMMEVFDNPDTLVADLDAVDDSDSTGTAYVLRDEMLYHKVIADLPDPADGTAYEGWLVIPGSTPPDFFSTGVMQKSDDGMYVLEYMSADLYEGYDRVVITLETVIDETPEVHIIEGTAQ